MCVCGDGRNPCQRGCTYGTIYYNVEVWNAYLGRRVKQSATRHCGCYGGRTGTCARCNGARRVECRNCAGSGFEDCGSCGSTGWFTLATTARLVGKPRREVIASRDAHAAFGKGVGEFRATEIPAMCTEVRPGNVSSTDTGLLAILDCTVPHMEVSADFGTIATMRFDAFGKGAVIPAMPSFLDSLLQTLDGEIDDDLEKGDMAGAVRLARSSRLTAAVLSAICTTGSKGTQPLVSIYEGAVSQVRRRAYGQAVESL